MHILASRGIAELAIPPFLCLTHCSMQILFLFLAIELSFQSHDYIYFFKPHVYIWLISDVISSKVNVDSLFKLFWYKLTKPPATHSRKIKNPSLSFTPVVGRFSITLLIKTRFIFSQKAAAFWLARSSLLVSTLSSTKCWNFRNNGRGSKNSLLWTASSKQRFISERKSSSNSSRTA